MGRVEIGPLVSEAARNKVMALVDDAIAKVGDTYARFRCATSGKLSYNGLATDGEVEDYKVTVKVKITALPTIAASRRPRAR